MAIIKCKMCGGDLVLTEGSTIAECEYCGTVQTVPAADNEKKLVLFERAERLRKACDFDKAATVYESIVADFRQEAEAYWGLVLCNYGIEYVDDPASGKKVPTCHRTSFDSIMDDINFEQALENADTVARKVYREEAKAIEEIRKGINEVSSKEAPYDIFICYKETDENGDRTLDSVMAQDIYDALVEKGYRVFFSRITLEDKLGQEYEPYIFAALNSAKVMLAIGTDYEYYNAVWVKNEWSRFLKMIALGQKKTLIPCFKNIDAYDMPKEFAKLQAQDLGKVGAMQDLLRGIEKLIPVGGKGAATAPVSGNNLIEETLHKAFEMLNAQDWESAQRSLDTVRGYAPDSAMALVGCLMVQMRCPQMEKLGAGTMPLDSSEYFQRAMKTADEQLKKQLTEYNNSTIYNYAMMQSQKNQIPTVEDAITQMRRLSGFRDADQQVAALQTQLAKLKSKKRTKKIVIAASIVAIIVAIVAVVLILVNNAKKDAYNEGTVYMQAGNYKQAVQSFEKADNYEDAEMLLAESQELAAVVDEKLLLLANGGMGEYKIVTHDGKNVNGVLQIIYSASSAVQEASWIYDTAGTQIMVPVEPIGPGETIQEPLQVTEEVIKGTAAYLPEQDQYIFTTDEGVVLEGVLNAGVLTISGNSNMAQYEFLSPAVEDARKYEKGLEAMNAGLYSDAMGYFGSILDYNDASGLYDECMRLQEEMYWEAEMFIQQLESEPSETIDFMCTPGDVNDPDYIFEEIVLPEVEEGKFDSAIQYLNDGTILQIEYLMVVSDYAMQHADGGSVNLSQIRSECKAINYCLIYMFGM